MKKSDLQNKLSQLWSAVIVVDGCVSKSSTTTAQIIFHRDRIHVYGPYGYGEALLPEAFDFSEIVSLPGSEITTLLTAAPEGELKLILKDSALIVKSMRFKGTVPVQILDDLPEPIDLGKISDEIDLDEEQWGSLRFASEFTAKAGYSMPELTCVYWGVEGIVACNGLSVLHYPTAVRQGSVLLPQAALLGTFKLPGSPKRVTIGDYHLRWDWDAFRIITPSAIGDYPVNRLLEIIEAARQGASTWTCVSVRLRDAVARLSLVADTLRLTFHPQKLLIQADANVQATEVVAGKLEDETGVASKQFFFGTSEAKRFVADTDLNWRMNADAKAPNLVILTDNELYCIGTILTAEEAA